MILSDVDLRKEIAAGRLVIEPFDETMVQPSSIDLHCDNKFRVFKNSRAPYIDVRQPMEDLTELVEVAADEPFILHPGEFVLGSTLERVALPDDLVARLEGKALSIYTEVPTPAGWRTMGELAPGDVVFDETGAPTLVLAATEILQRRPCREVEFSDGTIVIADASHRWVTTDVRERRAGRGPSIRTTDEIAGSLLVRGRRNHLVALAGAVRYPEQTLPVDPYEFGQSLGRSFAAAEGIPPIYLRASVEQRQALLGGLIDGAGAENERCEFTAADERLADDVAELAASLGLLPVKRKRHASSAEMGPSYRVSFPRREGRRHRAIAAVREIPSVPVRCIQVAAPSGQFLITRSFIPTHNSSLGRLGLLIHSTAGFVDAGWDGYLTLELSNVANLPITIYPGMKIGQLCVFRMSSPAERSYAVTGKYQGQRGPTPSKFYMDFRAAEAARQRAAKKIGKPRKTTRPDPGQPGGPPG